MVSGTDEADWENLSARKKEFYILCVEELALYKDLMMIAMED